MNPRVLPTWIRRPLGRMWRARGGGYYGMGYVVSYFVLEIRMLVGDLQETEGVADFITGQVLGFFVESFINAFVALAWPFLLVAEYELWGVGLLIVGYFVFERLIKPSLVKWFPAEEERK